MTRNGKRELLEAIRTRYRQGSKAEKTHILDEFVHNRGRPRTPKRRFRVVRIQPIMAHTP